MSHRKFFFSPSEGGCVLCPACSQLQGHEGACDCDCLTARTYWFAEDLTRVPVDEPLLVSLWKYDLHDDRHRVEKRSNANLVSSITREGMQVPIIDLDYPHAYIPSATPGHGHLYLNVPVSRWRWWVLMIGLRVGGVIEKGFFVWSLRRGGNFTRLPGADKSDHGESRSGFGWILPKRKNEQEK